MTQSFSLPVKVCALLVLLAAGALLLVAFMTMFGSNGGTTPVSAGAPPTPKPNNDGDLSDIIDLNIRQGGAGEEQFQCISRVDHDLTTNVIKTSSVCYINYAGAGDPAEIDLGRPIPCYSPFKAFCDEGDDEGINCTGPEPCTGPDAISGQAIIGPPPPPPYTIMEPQKGIGFYDPVGDSPECFSITGFSNTPCSAVRSCIADIGAGELGPNLGRLLIRPNPLTSQTPIAKMKLVKGIANDVCDDLTFTIPGVLYGGLQVTVTESSDTPLSYRGVDAACAADYTACDFDGDGCTDYDELSKPGTQPKGCGDDPWNPNDSNKTDFSGAYEILIRVLRAETTPGYGGIYFNCLADIQQTGSGKTDGELVARTFCYTDSFFSVVNNLDSPGITGDGQAGGSPPFGAIPIEPPCANPNDCTEAEELEAEADCARGLHGTGDLDEDDDGVANDGCKSEAFGDIDSKHVVLTGFIDNGDNTLKIRGCFEDEDASSSIGNAYVEMTVGKNTGQGFVDIWTWQPEATCVAGADWGSYLGAWDGIHPANDPGCPCADPNGVFDDAEISIVRQPGGQFRDTDQDGCSDASELSDDPLLGGLRDPFNPYDFYDVTGGGRIRLVDVLGVSEHWQPMLGGAPPYDVLFDRPPTMGGAFGSWNRGAPDGMIDLVNDILGVIDQYGHDCQGLGSPPLPPSPGLAFSLGVDANGDTTDDCDTSGGPTKCALSPGQTFTLNLYLDSLPTGVTSYQILEAYVTYTGLSSVDNPSMSAWPDCLSGLAFVQPGSVRWGCLTGVLPPIPSSFYTGLIGTSDFNCDAAGTLTLVHGQQDTVLHENSTTPHVEGNGTSETLTINCTGTTITDTPTPTITPTPTPTPNFIPAQGKIFPVAGGSVGDTLPATAAALSSPVDVAVDEPGGSQVDVYIADRDHCRIRLITVGGGASTVAGTGECGYEGDGDLAVDARLNHPTGVDVDDNGNIYIADEGNCRVRRVDSGTGNITTVAGSATCGFSGDPGTATASKLDGPYDVLVVDGKDLLIVDRGNCRVRKVDISADTITTVAGSDPGGGPCNYSGENVPAVTAQLSDPRRLALDAGGNLYISDGGNGSDCRVRKVDSGTGNITTIAGGATCGSSGDGGSATAALLSEPDGLAFDSVTGELYIADLGTCRVRVVSGGNINPFAGSGTCGYDGEGSDPMLLKLNAPSGLALDSSQRLYIADRDNHRIRRVGSPITTIAGTGLPDFCGDTFVAIDRSCLDSPHDVSIDDSGNVYIADVGNHRIRVITAGTGRIDTLAGKNDQTDCSSNTNTTGASALTLCLALPRHIAVSPDDEYLYISDEGRHQIWRVDISSGASAGEFKRVAGAANGATGLCETVLDNSPSWTLACLDQPRGLALQQVGGLDTYLFVAQGGNNGHVLRIDLINNSVRTVFGDTGGNVPSSDVALGPGPGLSFSLYIAQPDEHRVRWVDTGADSYVDGTDDPPVTVAGSGTPGLTTTDGIVATLADLDGPHAIAMNKDSDLLISDRNNHRLWVVRTGNSTPNVVDGEPSERIYRIAGGGTPPPGTPPPGYCGYPQAKPDPTPPNTPMPPNAQNARVACLHSPADLSYDYYNPTPNPTPPISRSTLYFADELNHRVRKIDSDCDDDGLTDAVELAGLVSTEPGFGRFFTNECAADTDGDGCNDAEEIGPNEADGGRRDPTNKWDWYDVNQDGVIDIVFDILGVIDHWQPLPGGAPPYDATFDRGPSPLTPSEGPNPWNMTGPDGIIDLVTDILGVIDQWSPLGCA